MLSITERERERERERKEREGEREGIKYTRNEIHKVNVGVMCFNLILHSLYNSINTCNANINYTFLYIINYLPDLSYIYDLPWSDCRSTAQHTILKEFQYLLKSEQCNKYHMWARWKHGVRNLGKPVLLSGWYKTSQHRSKTYFFSEKENNNKRLKNYERKLYPNAETCFATKIYARIVQIFTTELG